jgi:hypothetical protein
MVAWHATPIMGQSLCYHEVWNEGTNDRVLGKENFLVSVAATHNEADLTEACPVSSQFY